MPLLFDKNSHSQPAPKSIEEILKLLINQIEAQKLPAPKQDEALIELGKKLCNVPDQVATKLIKDVVESMAKGDKLDKEKPKSETVDHILNAIDFQLKTITPEKVKSMLEEAKGLPSPVPEKVAVEGKLVPVLEESNSIGQQLESQSPSVKPKQEPELDSGPKKGPRNP